MTSPSGAEAPLADVLSEVWCEQARIGFLLSDSEGEKVEVRYVEDPVSQVRFRFRWMPHRKHRTDISELEARGILNPERDESVLFRDPRDPSGRFCFLCPGNIRECNPREELVPIRLAGREYFAGANFAWIGREHFTVMAADHVDQSFSAHAASAMLNLHALTGGTFRVIYNGAHAGATIPWHLHYQITSEVLPVEGLPAGHEEAYPTTIRRFSAGDEGAPLAYAEEWMRRDVEHHRVNAMVAGPVSSPTVYVFQRDIRKSHAAAKGLMGGFEVCGDFVYSDSGKGAHFDRASAELARSLLADISPE